MNAAEMAVFSVFWQNNGLGPLGAKSPIYEFYHPTNILIHILRGWGNLLDQKSSQKLQLKAQMG